MDLLTQLKKGLSSISNEVGDFKPVATPKAEKAIDPYFKVDGYISKSGMCQLEKQRLGTYKAVPSSVFRQGSMFDSFFTEPERFAADWDVTDLELLQLLRAKKAITDTGVLPDNYSEWHRIVINGGKAAIPKGLSLQREIYRERFKVDNMFVKAKIKTDFKFSKQIIDLKTTTKQSYLSFKPDILKHGLDIQAAFYSDIARVKDFSLIVCPYFKSHHLQKAKFGTQEWIDVASDKAQCWVIDMKPYLEIGRIKYKRLIKDAIEANQIQPI